MKAASCLAALIICGLWLTDSAVFCQENTQPPEQETPHPEISPKVRAQIQKGMEYLVNSQDSKTGAFDTSNRLASTSLAGMALLSGGHLPGRGKYCQNVEDAIKFILEKAVNPSGYLQFEGSNMYSHGFAALFLAEVYGNIPPYKDLQPKIHKALKRAVELIEKSQNAEGGWWYNPLKNSGGAGADISVTVCETNALRAARNCGIAVDKRVIEKALKCVMRAANPDGGFNYRVYVTGASGGSAFERSAGAVCILQALGAHESTQAKKGLEYLLKHRITDPKTKTWDRFYYYGAYYASQSMFMAGKPYWDQWWPGMRDQLLSLQKPQGDFDASVGRGGPAYSTAVALVVLQMPYRYLPIYQEGIENGGGASE